LGIAGMSLAMASGASASTAGSAVDVPVQNTATHHELFLGEEEISNVSLSTFYVFDKENDDPNLHRRGRRTPDRGLPQRPSSLPDTTSRLPSDAGLADSIRPLSLCLHGRTPGPQISDGSDTLSFDLLCD
jgi:hypothetical protein